MLVELGLWLIGLVVALSICALVGQARWANADISFEARVACQRAIEEVYWKHTLWPEVNTSPKPPLSEVISEEEVRKKVAETLRMSKALEVIWKQPVEGYQLQAELERMAETTRNTEMLRELWSALGNDPQLIAEVLARQTLVERLIHDWYAFDERFHGRLKKRAMRKVESLGSIEDMKGMKDTYHEIEWQRGKNRDATAKDNNSGDVLELSEDEWQDAIGKLAEIFGEEEGNIPLKQVSVLQEDADRFYVVEVLMKETDQLKVAVVDWKKAGFDVWWSRVNERFTPDMEGEAFNYRLPEIVAGDPLSYAPNTWSATPTNPSPSIRYHHTAVWTGTEMIVWGGADFGFLNTGGRYNPATHTWTPTSTTGAPGPRYLHTAVWTGTEMIIWAGLNAGFDYLNTGGRYNPSTNSWTSTSTTGVPSARYAHTAVWTGAQMIVYGGLSINGYTDTGGRYNPSTGSWTSTSTTGAPTARSTHTAVWTGTQMIVWGGWDGSGNLNTGGLYNPATNMWTATAITGAPSARSDHTAVWTGTEMIVWGGWDFKYLNTGGRYNPSTNSWTSTTTTGAPSERYEHTAVWAGTQMIVWGGWNGTNYFNTGGRYNPATNSWTSTSTIGVPTGRSNHTALWTGTQMIVWGGGGKLNTGGRYNPVTNSWTSTSTTGVPSGREEHSAVWTGTQMIVWGGKKLSTIYGQSYLNTGGRYNPTTNTWTATSTTGAPSVRYSHTAVWTGAQMIVWGGEVPDDIPFISQAKHTEVLTGTQMVKEGVNSTINPFRLSTGGRYNPSTNTWTTTSTTGNPSGRSNHTAVWTGTEMIVWGGYGNSDLYLNLNTGGRYNPSTNTWTATTTTGAPSARSNHTAVWTSTQMIVWGGGNNYNTGGRYNPATNMWTATSTTYAPTGRSEHTAVWTGAEMIVWGGRNSTAGYLNSGGRYSP